MTNLNSPSRLAKAGNLMIRLGLHVAVGGICLVSLIVLGVGCGMICIGTYIVAFAELGSF